NFYTCDDGQGGRRNGGTLSNLKYANGLVSGVSLTVDNAPGLWATSSTDPMYGPYIYPNSGNATVTINNLPAGVYAFYVYGYDGNYELSVITDYGNKTCRESPVVSPPNWQSGVQYALFSGVTISSGQELDLTVRNGLDGYAILAGMQLLQGTSLLDL